MIGNDVVDLTLAKTESNWQRKGFLNKIFTENEKILIQKSQNQELMVWNLWSRKEAAYKIWNRQTGIRKYNPVQFECFDLGFDVGKVRFKETVYNTKTEISENFIHTIAVVNDEDFAKVKFLKSDSKIKKQQNLPYFLDTKNNIVILSKSHHGSFERIIYLVKYKIKFIFL